MVNDIKLQRLKLAKSINNISHIRLVYIAMILSFIQNTLILYRCFRNHTTFDFMTLPTLPNSVFQFDVRNGIILYLSCSRETTKSARRGRAIGDLIADFSLRRARPLRTADDCTASPRYGYGHAPHVRLVGGKIVSSGTSLENSFLTSPQHHTDSAEKTSTIPPGPSSPFKTI